MGCCCIAGTALESKFSTSKQRIRERAYLFGAENIGVCSSSIALKKSMTAELREPFPFVVADDVEDVASDLDAEGEVCSLNDTAKLELSEGGC